MVSLPICSSTGRSSNMRGNVLVFEPSMETVSFAVPPDCRSIDSVASITVRRQSVKLIVIIILIEIGYHHKMTEKSQQSSTFGKSDSANLANIGGILWKLINLRHFWRFLLMADFIAPRKLCA